MKYNYINKSLILQRNLQIGFQNNKYSFKGMYKGKFLGYLPS